MSNIEHRHIVKFFLYIAVVFVLIFPTGCSKEQDPLPAEFESLTLDKKLTGKEAKDFLLRMHQGVVGSDKNEIGFYSGSEGGATIYISYFDDKFIAQDEFKRMTDKIAGGNTEFTNGDVFYIDGLKIYKCLGYSQSHFIFSLENRLFWLTSETSIIRKLISDYLDYLKK